MISNLLQGIIFNICTNQPIRPGGAHRIASILRENQWDIEVCDYADDWPYEQLQEFCKSRITSNTKFIGFSCFFDHWSEKIDDLVIWIRELYPNLLLIRGGQVPPKTLYPSYSIINYHVAGYGEKVIFELLKNTLGNGKFLPPLDLHFKLKGINLIDSNKFFPAWPMRKSSILYEKRDYIESWEWSTIEFSRGCKFQCPYCNFPVIGIKGDYTRDADDFEYQLRHGYDNWGISNYYCADETFNDRTEKIIKFADITEKLNFIPYFSSFMRGDLVAARSQDWEHLVRLNMLGQFYGIESMNYETTKLIGKGMQFEKLTEKLLEAKDYFLRNSGNRYRGTIALIVGLPHETKQTIEKTFSWIRKNWNDQCYMVWPLEISKDTAIDRQSKISLDYKSYGYLDQGTDVVYYENFVDNNSQHLNWKNEHFTFHDASEIAYNFDREKFDQNSTYKLGGYELAQVSMLGDIHDILSYKHNDVKILSEKLHIIKQRFLLRYIHKKLS